MKYLAALALILSIVAVGFSLNGTKISSGPNGIELGANAGPDHYVYQNFFDGVLARKLTQGGGTLRFTATSTQSARTLTQSELSDYSVFEIVSTSSPALTITLPATSTLTSLIKQAGDSRTWFFDNQHLAATTTTFAAGAGIDLVAYTVNDDVIDGQEVAQLTCWRKFNTDVYCLVSEILKSD